MLSEEEYHDIVQDKRRKMMALETIPKHKRGDSHMAYCARRMEKGPFLSQSAPASLPQNVLLIGYVSILATPPHTELRLDAILQN